MVTLTPLEIALGVIALLLVVGVILTLVRNRRRAHYRSRFGAEYDRTVREAGGARRAEAALTAREKRVSAFDIRPLSPMKREEFVLVWRQVQQTFIDDPAGALDHADVLLADVMVARGYPIADFENRAADLSVDHGEVVQNYRAGHAIALSHARGEATTEDLRHAMIHYRALFDELVNEPSAIAGEPGRDWPGQRIRH